MRDESRSTWLEDAVLEETSCFSWATSPWSWFTSLAQVGGGLPLPELLSLPSAMIRAITPMIAASTAIAEPTLDQKLALSIFSASTGSSTTSRSAGTTSRSTAVPIGRVACVGVGSPGGGSCGEEVACPLRAA